MLLWCRNPVFISIVFPRFVWFITTHISSSLASHPSILFLSRMYLLPPTITKSLYYSLEIRQHTKNTQMLFIYMTNMCIVYHHHHHVWWLNHPHSSVSVCVCFIKRMIRNSGVECGHVSTSWKFNTISSGNRK